MVICFVFTLPLFGLTSHFVSFVSKNCFLKGAYTIMEVYSAAGCWTQKNAQVTFFHTVSR